MRIWKIIKGIAVILLLISLFCTVDLGVNLLYNAEPSVHDGSYGTYSILHTVFGIFGDTLWSFDRFFLVWKNAAFITYALVVVNVVLHFFKVKES